MALAAGTDVRYTVRNLAQASNYTVCATNGTDNTSATFSTTAMGAFGSAAWVKVGNARFFAGMATNQSLAFVPDGTPYVAHKEILNGNNKTTVMRLVGTAGAPTAVTAVAGNGQATVSFTPAATAAAPSPATP